MRLECGPCALRDWSLTDKASLLRYANNRNVWRNLTNRFPNPYTEADADSWLGKRVHGTAANNWAIEVAGEAVGGIGFERHEDVFARGARFGYWLGEPFWNRGITTAAVRAAADHIFATSDLERLEAPVFEWNAASMRLLEKCGFIREGVLRRSVSKDGRLIDCMLYARLRP